jgi:GntR family transcriptional regulator, transcriptional repressor for pyruvate dehydrogenase complex
MTAEPSTTALDTAVLRLEELVVDQLRPGMQLPSEATLADDIGVSRLTLREALKVLAGRGLVDQGRGRKTTVRHPDSSLFSSQLSIAMRREPRAVLELYEIRQALEVLSAARAARNRSSAAMAAIEGALMKLDDAAAALDDTHLSVERYNDADFGFHAALALASDNGMLASILESLSDALHQSMSLSFDGFLSAGGNIQDAVASHREIFELVRDGNARGAEVAMRHHLQAAERDLRFALRD